MKCVAGRRARRRGDGRTPQGVRGLKCRWATLLCLASIVAPRKGCVD